MITRQTIDAIMDATRIEEVVGDFVQLKKAGSSMKALSPFTNEKTPSFVVSPAKQIFKCFSSGKGGSAITFLMELEQMTYPEALRYLAKKYNIEVEEEEQTEEAKEEQSKRESLYVVSEFAQDWFANQLTESEEGKAVGLSYFRERGFTQETIDSFKLGYSPESWEAFLKASEEKGYKKEYLLETGLLKEREQQDGSKRTYDAYRGRVIFPIHNQSGRPVGFGARILRSDSKAPKYINSPESDIYRKTYIVYGIYQAKQAIVKEDNCFLVEGYTDVLALHQAGVKHVVASSGTALTKEQIRLINRFTNNITVLYDGDSAGIKAGFRGIDLILEEGLQVKTVLLPEGEDPDSFAKKMSGDELASYLKENAKDFIRFKTAALIDEVGDDPIKKTGLIHEIVNSIALIPDHIARAVYVKECSKLLDVPEQALITELNKARRKYRDEKIKEERRSLDRQTRVQNNTLPPPPSEVPPPPMEEQGASSATSSFYDHNEAVVEKERETLFQERDLLRVLLNYGNDDIEVAVEDHTDEEVHTTNVITTVGHYIVHDLTTDEIDFRHDVYRQIFDHCKELIMKDQPLNTSGIIAESSPEVQKTVAELLVERYALHDWERKEIYVSTEQMKLKKAVDGSLFAFKTKHIERLISENQFALKEAYGKGEDILPLLEDQTKLQELKKQIAELQGITILK